MVALKYNREVHETKTGNYEECLGGGRWRGSEIGCKESECDQNILYPCLATL